MNKVFLLDAYALIYRAYYAFIKNPRINSKGLNTSAILGFVNTLEEVIKKENPTHLAVVFDPSGPTFRHEAYEQYKAQREVTPEAIRVAVPEIKRILCAYRIAVIQMPGYEADDVIGSLSVNLSIDPDTQIFMMTPDKDYAQLVKPNVWMYRPGTGTNDAELLGCKEIREKYGIDHESQIIDMLGLMGDKADNIPGCAGVGEKTAVSLIRQFGSIEKMLENTHLIKGKLRDKIEEHRQDIIFSKWLATIKTDVVLNIGLQDIAIQKPDYQELSNIFEELEFRMLLSKNKKEKEEKSKFEDKKVSSPVANGYAADLFSAVPEWSSSIPASKVSNTLKRRMEDVNPKYHLLIQQRDIEELVDRLQQVSLLCLDTETTSTEAMRAHLVGMSFSISPGEAWYVPYSSDNLEILRPIYEREDSLKIGQNLKYDLMVLANHGVHLRGKMADTMLAHYLISPELHHGLDYLADIYLNYETIHIEELIGHKGKNQRNMSDLSPEKIYAYACEDADITLQLWEKLSIQLQEKGLENLFWDVEMKLMPVLARIERNGVRINTQGLKQISLEFTEKLRNIEDEIHALAGVEFNVSSPKQVGEVLFEKLKITDKAKKTKTGKYVTSEEILESLRTKHPIIEKILQYRGLKKLLGTYVDALPLLVNPATGHIHTSFNQAVAQTGRLSSSNPNLQNIPVRDSQGKEVRKVFVAEEGEYFFSADYSQIELRIMAHLSADENLIEAFLQDNDIHAATAAKIFHKPIHEVSSEERRRAKTANFGIIYGISAFGLAERLGCSRAEAKALIDDYFSTYPKVKQYMDRSIAMARELGYTQTILGRRLSLPDINSGNAIVRGYAERNAINAPIQGSAADIIKLAMIRLDKRMQREGVRSKMILQVHDELNFSVPAQERELMQRIVTEEMQSAFSLSVPLIADSGWGYNWLEAH